MSLIEEKASIQKKAKTFLSLVLLLLSFGFFKNMVLADENENLSIERFKWVGELPVSKNIIVKNYYGDISTQTISKPIVHVQSVYQRIGEGAPKPEFKIKESKKGLEIEVLYPKEVFSSNSKQSSVRADLGLYIPEGYKLVLETTYGNIKAKKHQSDIFARTNRGNINIATSGEVDLLSEQGNIFVGPRADRWKGDQKVLARSGNVTVLLPQNVNLNLNVSGAKGVQSNLKRYGIEFSSDNPRTLTSRLGNASSSFSALAPGGVVEVIYDRKTEQDYAN